jgi:hypothetical protein
MHCSPALVRCQMKSAKHKSHFSLTNSINGRRVTAVLVSSGGQLLVGQLGERQLHVYSADCCHVTSIKLPDNDMVWDAVWTKRGNIVYCEWVRGKIVTMSQAGDVIQHTNVSMPTNPSMSTDDVIYFTSAGTSVYQSTDDGLTWSRMFTVADGWQCCQVIKVSTDSNTDVLWTVVNSVEDWRLQVCTVDKRRAGGNNVTWRDVTLPSHVTVDLKCSRLAYDGNASILVMDNKNRAVHVWSVSGQYDRQLVSPQQLISHPRRVAVDTQRHVMYVGHENGTAGVFELTYELV